MYWFSIPYKLCHYIREHVFHNFLFIKCFDFMQTFSVSVGFNEILEFEIKESLK